MGLTWKENMSFFSLGLDGNEEAALKVVILMNQKCISVIHIDVYFIKSKCTKELTFKKKATGCLKCLTCWCGLLRHPFQRQNRECQSTQ